MTADRSGRFALGALRMALILSAVIPAKHNVALSLGVDGVNCSARTVDWSLISSEEGDIGQNSPTV